MDRMNELAFYTLAGAARTPRDLIAEVQQAEAEEAPDVGSADAEDAHASLLEHAEEQGPAAEPRPPEDDPAPETETTAEPGAEPPVALPHQARAG